MSAFEERERRRLQELQWSDPEGYQEILAEFSRLCRDCRHEWPEKNEEAFPKER